MTSNHRTRSPLRERARTTSPKRGGEVDYGHDAERHVRHIARTKQLTTFAGEEGTQRSWSWVLHSLVHHRSNRGRGCPVDILDTVIYGADGAPETLYYSSGGTVASKVIGEDGGCISLAKAMLHLRPPKRYIAALNAAAEINGAVAFTSEEEAVAVKTIDMEKIRKGQGTPPTGTEALVLLVPTKAPMAELLLSVQHAFTLEPSVAKPVHSSYRLVMLKGGSKRVACKSHAINRKLERMCKQVIEWIEACGGARVLRLVLEFVEDALGALWLVRSSECCTTKTVCTYSRQRRSPSPSQSKAVRLHAAKDIANELSLLRYGYKIGESAPSPNTGVTAMAPSPIGGAVNETGTYRRPHTAMSPAEISGSQGTIDAEEWGFDRSDSPIRSLDARRPQTTAVPAAADATRGGRQEQDGDQGVGLMFRGFAAPGERDPREIGRTAAAGRALGSSQLGLMCHGDFCNTDLLDKVLSVFPFFHPHQTQHAVLFRERRKHVKQMGLQQIGDNTLCT